MSDIFISYATADRESARDLAQALGAYGWSVWWDREIPFGESFDRVIERELASARSVIVLWSKASVDSDWVRNEARHGLSRGALIPARIEAVALPLEFSNVQTADLTGWRSGRPHPAFDRLVARLKIVLDEAASAKAAPIPSTPIAPAEPASAFRGGGSQPQPKRLVWGAAALVLLLAVGGLGYWFSVSKSGVEMPDLIGKQLDAAASVIAENGLELAPAARVESEEAPPGVVIEQSPRAGSRVQRGTAVEIVVVDAPKRAVPSLVGVTPAVAEQRVMEAGLRLGRVANEDSPDAQPGTVIGQHPEPDSRVPKDSSVDIVVAEAARVTVPDVRGTPLDAAQQTLEKARLTVGRVRERETPDEKPGLVITQRQEPGSVVARGTAVDLLVAVEPATAALIEMPDVRKLHVKEASSRVLKSGFGKPRLEPVVNNEAKTDTVIEQDPPAGKSVPRDAPVTLVYARPATRSVEAGPIWNQNDANKKCPVVCAKANGKWTGHWWTTVQGKMSVCQCTF